MRFKQILLFLTVLIAISCRRSDDRAAAYLNRAENIMEENYDSALILLDSITDAPGSLSRADYMRYLTCRVSAMNKAYIPLDTVSFMPLVLQYYKSHGTPSELTLAYYLTGSVYRDKGDAPRAISYFKDAVAVQHSEYTQADYLLISHAYGQMAWLFEDMRYPRQSLRMRDERIRYALLAGDTLAAIQSYDYKAGIYLVTGRADSAMYISRRVYSALRKMGRPDIAAGILPTQINYYLVTDSLEQARRAIDEYVSLSGMVDKSSRRMLSPEAAPFYNDWALYYQKTNRPDSALHFYRLAMKCPLRENLRRSYRGLISLYSQLNRPDSVLKYTHLYTDIVDSLYLQNSTSEIARTEALYNYSQSKENALLKSREADRLRTTIYIIISISILLGLVVFFYLRRQRVRRRDELIAVNQKYTDTLQLYNRALSEIESLNTDISEYKLNKAAELERLSQVLSSYQDNVNPVRWNFEQNLMQHDVVTQMHRDASRAHTASDSQWADLEEVVRKFLPEFFSYVDGHRAELNYKEFRVCILTRLNFIPTEVATLMDVTKQRVTNMRASVNKKLFGDSGSKTFDANIHKM